MFLNSLNPFRRTMALAITQHLRGVPGIFLGSKARPARKAYILTAISEANI
jgi:hypothetical protein